MAINYVSFALGAICLTIMKPPQFVAWVLHGGTTTKSTLHGSLGYLRRGSGAAKSSVRSAMFIATCAVGGVKLRRSGMNGAGDQDQADPDPCRSYGAWLGVRVRRGYKHGAPNGACPAVASTDACKEQTARAPWGNWAYDCNPKGIVYSSPGLRGTSYPGLAPVQFSTPTGLCPVTASKTQPRWGWPTPPAFPRVARASQPWALGRNPFGIQR